VPVREQRCVDLATEYTDSIHLVLILKPLDQTIVPPHSQAFQRLDYAITQKVPLRCNRLFALLKGLPAFAGYCWIDESIEGPLLQGREGFLYIWLTLPGYRIEPLSDRDGTRYLVPPIWCTRPPTRGRKLDMCRVADS
jgi:hypothetical protein